MDVVTAQPTQGSGEGGDQCLLLILVVILRASTVGYLIAERSKHV